MTSFVLVEAVVRFRILKLRRLKSRVTNLRREKFARREPVGRNLSEPYGTSRRNRSPTLS